MGTVYITKEARIYNGAKTASSIINAWKTEQLHAKKKKEIRKLHNTIHKLKWIKDLNVTPESIQLLEENIGRTFDDINQARSSMSHLSE